MTKTTPAALSLSSLALALAACSASNGEPHGTSNSTQPLGTTTTITTSGLCVDVQWAGTDNGTPVQLWSCNGRGAQSWTLDNGSIVGLGGKCLDVRWGDSANGTSVQIWDCNGTDAQRWTYSGGQLVGVGGKCLDVPAFQFDAGQTLDIWDCNGGSNQQFTLDDGSGGSGSGGGSGGGNGGGNGGCPSSSEALDGVADPGHPSGMAPPTCDAPGFTRNVIDDLDGSSSGWEFPQGFQYLYSWVGGNSSIANGILDMSGTYASGDEAVVGWAQNKSYVQTYGKWLVRMRADAATNLAVAPLLWPQSEQWPQDGEIDFAEDDIGSRQAYAFSHYADASGNNQYTWNGPETAHPMTDWHTWGVEWTPTSLKYTVDGTVWSEDTLAAAIPQKPMWLGFVMSCMLGACPQGMDAHWQVDWVATYTYAQ